MSWRLHFTGTRPGAALEARGVTEGLYVGKIVRVHDRAYRVAEVAGERVVLAPLA